MMPVQITVPNAMHYCRVTTALVILQMLFLKPADPQSITAKTWNSKFATPGASVELKQLKNDTDLHATTYAITLSGFGSADVIDVWVWRVSKEPRILASGLSTKQGTLACDGQARGISYEHIDCKGLQESAEITIAARQGEPVGLAFVSDQKDKVFTKVVPFPLEVVSGECSSSIEQEDEGGTFFVVTAKGLRPNESFHAVMISEGERAKLNLKADVNGVWRSMVAPVVKGKSGGVGNIDLEAQSCNVHLVYK